MLKRILFLALVFTATSLLANAAGTVLLEPNNPDQNGAVTITYTPDNQFKAVEDLTVVYYAFEADKSEPKAYSIKMLKSPREVFVAIVPLQKTTVFGMVKFGDGLNFDDNNGSYWEILAYNREKPVENAALKCASSLYGRSPYQYRRKNDLDRAQEMFELELKNYPSNIVAQIGLASIKRDLKKISGEEFNKTLADILSGVKHAKSDAEATAIIRAYRMLNDSTKADKFEKDYLKKNPESSMHEDKAIDGLKRADADKEKKTLDFLKKYPNSSYNDNAIYDLANTYLNTGLAQKTLDFLAQCPNVNPEIVTDISLYFLGKDTLLAPALSYVEKFASNFEKNYRDLKPGFYASEEWEYQAASYVAELARVKGTFQAKLKNNDKAYSELTRSLTIYLKLKDPEAGSMTALYASLISVSQALNKSDEAIKFSEMAIKGNYASSEIESSYLEICKTKNIANADAKLAELKKEAKVKRFAKLREDKLNMPFIEGKLKNLKGETVNLSDYKGKVIVVDFWATWCGPCKQSFPYMQKMYDKYKDNPNFVLLVVDVWEREKDRMSVVSKFIQAKGYTFPVCLDENDETVRKFGVTGIPTKFFIDKKGIIQYKEVGFAGETKFIDDFNDKMEILLGE